MSEPLATDDPTHLGDITFERRIGEGGSAVVYLGRTPAGDQVAVKVLHRHLAGSLGVRDLLNREARALERVGGSRVARVLKVDTQGPQPYLVTEYVPGAPLSETVATAPLSGG